MGTPGGTGASVGNPGCDCNRGATVGATADTWECCPGPASSLKAALFPAGSPELRTVPGKQQTNVS